MNKNKTSSAKNAKTPEKDQATLKRFFAAQDRLVFQASDLSLGSLAQMVDSHVIDTEPKYQRRNRWRVEKKSALIESFLLNVPVPPIYLAEDRLGKYSVVDGKQRLTAIADFIGNRFALVQLESMHEVERARFDDLPDELRNALTIRPYLRVITILKQSDPLLKYEVFVRLNRGGESMEPQELRNVAFRGPLNDLVYQLSESTFLHGQLKIIPKRKPAVYQLMGDAELVLRFLTMREVWATFTGGLREAMDRFMSEHQTASKPALEKMKSRFLRALKGCKDIWAEHSFRRPVAGGWRDQFLNGMYDAEMLAVEALTDRELTAAVAARAAVVKTTRDLFDDPQFDRAVREATNTPARIKFRVQKILDGIRQQI